MVAAANYNRPKPVDPLWYRLDCLLHIRCGCGRTLTEEVGMFGARHSLREDLKLYQLIERLRCRSCGGRPEATVTEPRG